MPTATEEVHVDRDGPVVTIIPYYNQRASNPAIAPRSDWLDAQQGHESAAR